ncbi:MAG TPA: DUF3263 domain-containing protein [Acidothermaceae bacterium]|nr:DUF3263 domain-containing protein [Acidothermaceae bacterium]
MTAAALTAKQRYVLDFEASWQYYIARAGAKDAAIVEEFGLSTVAYYQVLNRLLDLEAALAYDPVLVNRLRRIRDDRMARVSSSAVPS